MFKKGDLVRIKNTPHMMEWSKPKGIHIGKTFIIDFEEGKLGKFERRWLKGEIISCVCDRKNTYGINYHIDDLELVNPSEPIYEIY